MIEEAYCSFEVSKLLKEKGFNESTQLVWYEHLPSANAVRNSEIGKPKRDYFYWSEEEERNFSWTNNYPIPLYISGEVYSCPTHQMAMQWLRDEHDIFITVFPDKIHNTIALFWNVYVVTEKEYKWIFAGGGVNMTYEELIEEALLYVLKTLINYDTV